MSIRRSTRPPKPDAPNTWRSSSAAPLVSLAWISRPRVGEIENGDDVVIVERDGVAIIVVVDALGHGPSAAKVAHTATEWVRATPAAATVVDLTQGLHRALQTSRGIAALVLTVAPAAIEACGVGNVDLRTGNGRLPFVLTPGVLGVRLRSPKTCRVAAPFTDRFVIHSDGISGRFDIKATTGLDPSEVATQIFAKHRHTHDDSTVLVADVTI